VAEINYHGGKMKTKPLPRLQNIKPSLVFLFLAIIIGGALRLSPVLNVSFPLNDGGLFFTMTEELVEAGFRIPRFSDYNQLQIPFVYPPLAFFLVGGVYKLTGWELLDIFRILPAVFSVFAIPAFYLLAKEFLEDDFKLGISVLIFSFLPATIEWLIMGGGITRAPGFVFSTLALRSGYLLYVRNRKSDVIYTAIFSSLTILFHPEAAVHTAAGIFVFFLFKGRNTSLLIKSLLVILLILGMTSFWWIPVLRYHGLGPITAAGRTGLHNSQNLINFILFNVTNEIGLSSIGVFALIGLFISVSSRKSLLAVWLLLTFFVDPRAAILYMSPIIALLAADLLFLIILMLDNKTSRVLGYSGIVEPLSSLSSKALLLVLIFYWIVSCWLTGSNVVEKYLLTSEDIAAMEWVKINTPIESRFIILSGNYPFLDPSSEWFPAVAQRASIATVQGHEWIIDTDFDKLFDNSFEVQKCIIQDLDCVLEWQELVKKNFDYIYLHKSMITQYSSKTNTTALSGYIEKSNLFELVYETEKIIIYEEIKSSN
jgi:hypothetical protein